MGNNPITNLQPVGRTQGVGFIHQSTSISKTFSLHIDFYPKIFNSLVFFAGMIVDHTQCSSSLIPYTLQGLWY
jgi:hypothetical protein